MSVIVLDTRAIEVFADPKADARATQLVRDMLAAATRMGTPVRVPTAVLAEVYRGTGADAAIDRVLGEGIRPITLGQAMARQTGKLKHRDRLDSCYTVDAAVVATAIRLGGGIIMTGDPDDLRSLARDHSNIGVHGLSDLGTVPHCGLAGHGGMASETAFVGDDHKFGPVAGGGVTGR